MKIVFVIDDDQTSLKAASDALLVYYNVYTISSATKMFKILEKVLPDIILLDIEMPDTNGFEVIRDLKADQRYKDIPVLFLTATQQTEDELRGFELGAVDFILKPFSSPSLLKRLELHLEMDRLLKERENKVLSMQNSMIAVIANMVENRDDVTGGHIERTQYYLEILIKNMIKAGLYEDELRSWDLDLLLPSAQLHDIGKIAISDLLLDAPRKLSDEEFSLMKRHVIKGELMIDEIIAKTPEARYLYHAKMFAGYHHERWDGLGYPHNLAGLKIPLEGRIMAIADVYDALTSKRPYKEPYPHERAVEIIARESGTHFDPDIVRVFLDCADEFKACGNSLSK